MAQDEQAGEAVAPKNKKKLVIIILTLVVVLAVAGGVVLMLMGGKKKHGGKEAAADDSSPAAVMVFEEKFTVNLQAEDGSIHYLQLPKLELEMANEDAVKKVEKRKSKVSDRINSTLRSKSYQEMMAPGSDLKLKEDLKKVINEALDVRPIEADKKGVREVLLPGSFIVQ